MNKKLLIFLALFSWANTSTVLANVQSCNTTISLQAPITEKLQHIDLSPTISIDLEQSLSYSTFEANRIAANVVCQKLAGTKYTGNIDEWQKFFDSALNGLLKAEYKAIKFTLVGEDDEVFKNKKSAKEYIFRGTKEGNEQVIYNLAILSEDKQSMLTLSVSGNIAAHQQIVNEYQRLVNSIEFDDELLGRIK